MNTFLALCVISTIWLATTMPICASEVRACDPSQYPPFANTMRCDNVTGKWVQDYGALKALMKADMIAECAKDPERPQSYCYTARSEQDGCPADPISDFTWNEIGKPYSKCRAK